MGADGWGAGRVVAGRYRLVEALGRGGMGAVWSADHVTLHSRVAIKLVHPALLADDDGAKRFLREAQAAAMLRSPHVVQILDHGVEDGVPYIAMELLDGESLSARLAREKRLSLAQTARVVVHVARAIGKAHQAGIIHRDLKPDNIFLVGNDDEELAKVLDFGIAKMSAGLEDAASKVNTRSGALLGTPYYMSPEQVRGRGVDARADLWSLSIIAFECMCGRVPFDTDTVGELLVQICTGPIPVPSEVAPVPAAFDAWFARGAERDITARFQSAREMSDALRAIVEQHSEKRFAAPDIAVHVATETVPSAAPRDPARNARLAAEDALTVPATSGDRLVREDTLRRRSGASTGDRSRRRRVRATIAVVGGACLTALAAFAFGRRNHNAAASAPDALQEGPAVGTFSSGTEPWPSSSAPVPTPPSAGDPSVPNSAGTSEGAVVTPGEPATAGSTNPSLPTHGPLPKAGVKPRDRGAPLVRPIGTPPPAAAPAPTKEELGF